MSPLDLPSLLEKIEVRYIKRALKASSGNQAGAARILGLKRTTLVEKLRKYRMGIYEARS